MARFERCDALLLYAIGYCASHEGIATLRGIYAATDAINRSAPEFEALRGGLARLGACGLIVDTGEGYVPTALGGELYAGLIRRPGNVFEHLEILRGLLEREAPPSEDARRIELPPDRAEAARDSYYGQ